MPAVLCCFHWSTLTSTYGETLHHPYSLDSSPLPPLLPQLVGIWCVAAWQQLGSPASLRLVELGPGRGTLMADLLRGTAAFQQFTQVRAGVVLQLVAVAKRGMPVRCCCCCMWLVLH